MNKEKKLAEFQNATAATIKAIAANKLKNREIQFFGNTTRFNSKQITIAKDSNDFDDKFVNKTRGESDEISLKLQYHDKTIHSKLKPSSDLAETIFNLAEDTRIEKIGGKKFFGVKKNLQKLIEKKFETNLIAPPGSDDVTSFVNAMHLQKKLYRHFLVVQLNLFQISSLLISVNFFLHQKICCHLFFQFLCLQLS